jgi:hypothetical protein
MFPTNLRDCNIVVIKNEFCGSLQVNKIMFSLMFVSGCNYAKEELRA